jgi:flagellar protein FlaG
MSMEIAGISRGLIPGMGRENIRNGYSRQNATTTNPEKSHQSIHTKTLEASLRELEELSQVFNRRLKLVVNNELDRVIVKVVDRETDTVIKELPSKELQRVYSRIREALGLLIDREI